MRRFSFLLIVSCATASLLWAQPKVAVLDAVVADSIDQSVVVPVTEKIVERLVVSGNYTVLDRTNVGQVLKEREFQVSGMVSDAEITEAGKFLGADFVVVAKVQQIADTYFLSSKMITVKTGVIANQTSAEGEGKLSVLLRLAEKVGDTLAGSTTSAATVIEPAKKTPVKEVVPVTATKPKKVVDNTVGFRIYGSFGSGTQDITRDGYIDESFDTSGFGLYILASPWKHFAFIGDLSLLDGIDDDGPTLTSMDVGVAFTLPLGIFMPYAGLKVGATSATWEDSDTSGVEAAIDLGVDLRLGAFLLGLRYQFQSTDLDFVSSATSTVDSTSTWFMLGLRF